MNFNYNSSGSIFYVPTLSDLPGNCIKRTPSAIHMTLEFTKGMITFGSFKYLILFLLMGIKLLLDHLVVCY